MSIRYLRLALSGVVLACAGSAFAQDAPLTDNSLADESEQGDLYVADPSQSFVFEPSESYEAALSGSSEDEGPELYAGESPTPLTQPGQSQQLSQQNCQTLRETVDGHNNGQATEGTLCEQPDGSWRALNPSTVASASPAAPQFRPECRDFRRQVMIEGHYETAYGRECQQPDGAWRTVSPPSVITDAVPVRTASQSTRNCREVERTIIIDGYARRAHGTECQRLDGSWQLVGPTGPRKPRLATNAEFRAPASYRTYRAYPSPLYDDQSWYDDSKNGRAHPGRGRNKPRKW